MVKRPERVRSLLPLFASAAVVVVVVVVVVVLILLHSLQSESETV